MLVLQIFLAGSEEKKRYYLEAELLALQAKKTIVAELGSASNVPTLGQPSSSQSGATS